MKVQFEPAFPNALGNSSGMTAFDYASIAVLQSIIQSRPDLAPEEAAELAIKYAEAMTNELVKKHAPPRKTAGAM